MTPEPFLTRSFALAWMASLFMGMSYMLFLHFPEFLADLGASEVEIGAVFAATAVAAIAVRPAVGRAMDLHGRRRVIIAGNVVNLVAVALYLTVDAVDAWAYAVRLLHGVAGAMLFTSLFTLGADIIPASRRVQGLALFGVSGLLPIGLAGLLGEAILAGSDFDGLFLTALALAVTAFALALPLRDQPADKTGGARRSFLAAILQRDLAPLWAIALVFSAAVQAYFVFMKTFTIERGFGSVGLFFACYSATAIGLRVVGGWLPDRVGQKKVLFPALGVLTAGFAVLAGAQSAAAIAVAGVLCGAGHGYAFPITIGMVVARARPAERGSAMAFYTALFDIALLLSGPAFGLVISLTSYRVMWLVAGATLAAGTVAFGVWDRRVAPEPVAAAAA